MTCKEYICMEQNTVESIKLFGKKFNIVSEADQ